MKLLPDSRVEDGKPERFSGGTSAMRALVPAVGAVRNAVAQFAHVDADFGPSAAVLVGGATCHGAVGT